MAAHRYWRMLVSANGFGSYAAMAELQAFVSTDGSGTSDLLGTTVAASSTYASGPAVLINGNFSDFWAANGGVNGEWVSFDLGAGVTKDLKSFTMYARNDSYSNQCPSAGSWQYSDDNAAWTTAFAFTAYTAPAAGQAQTFPQAPPTGIYFDLYSKSATIVLNSVQLKMTSTGAGSVGVFKAMTGPSYLEYVITALTGTPAVGLLNSGYVFTNNSLLGSDANSLGYRSGGAVVANGATLATLAAYVQGDRVDMAVDPANRLVWFRVNGGNWNNNAANNPATGVGGIDTSSVNFGRSVAAASASLTGTAIDAHIAAASFVGAAPAGFSELATIQTSVVRAGGYYAGPPVVAISYGPIVSVPPQGKPNKMFMPAGPLTNVSGILKELGVVKANKKIRMYDSADGSLVGDTISAADGTFTIPGIGRAAVFVVAFDPPYNALVYDSVNPG